MKHTDMLSVGGGEKPEYLKNNHGTTVSSNSKVDGW